MFIKTLAITLVLGICVAIPVEDPKDVEPVNPPVEVVPPYPQSVPSDLPSDIVPPKQDNSDLKTDASTWWTRTYYRPSVYEYVYSYPVYRTHRPYSYYWY